MLLAGAAVTTVAGLAGAAYVSLAHKSALMPIRSIAVLPFKPLVTDRREEALELGFADSLITKLSVIRAISIRPVGAVRRYMGLEQDPIAAGRELNVDAVLDGSIQRSGERLRVSVRFLRIADGCSLWNGMFDEKFTDIFAVQDAVSTKVTNSLTFQLSGEEQQHLARRDTYNAGAFQAYLLGRYFINKRTVAGLKKGIEHFRDALRLDAGYAPAYSGIADAFSALAMYEDLNPKDGFGQAKAAAVRALDLDPSLAEAHISLGLVLELYDWNFPAAEGEYRRGLELNPGYATGHQRYGFYLTNMGRIPEAHAEFSRALFLDPVSVIANMDAARPFYAAREYQKAAEQLRKAIEIDPSFHRAHSLLAHCYTQMGKYDDAMVEAERAIEFSAPQRQSGTCKINYQLGYIYAKAGRTSEARRMLEDLEKLRGAPELQAYFRPLAYAALRDRNRAYSWLEESYRTHSLLLLGIASDPAWDLLRGDQHFKDLLKSVGFAQ
jgi:TolB-like protein/tetratricopeptide (TPR) repeat protein